MHIKQISDVKDSSRFDLVIDFTDARSSNLFPWLNGLARVLHLIVRHDSTDPRRSRTNLDFYYRKIGGLDEVIDKLELANLQKMNIKISGKRYKIHFFN